MMLLVCTQERADEFFLLFAGFYACGEKFEKT